MCGIAGIVNLKGNPLDKTLLEKMIKVQEHRGPDGKGLFLDENIGLGHNRLAIIDLSSAASQPMSNEDGSLIITYNGEIYNYLELRKNLEKKGHIFKSNTDVEVILHSYEEYKENCLSVFNGMWAFAIWDKKNKELFCSRDRLGIKPFYYFLNEEFFAFASEIKALLELGILRRPNEELIYDFLKFGMLDHTDETFLKGIVKLPAACWLKVNLYSRPLIRRYWDFEVSDEIDGNEQSDQRYTEEFLELFIDAVRLRLRSDVAIGSCLSGGVDSSSIVCIINNLLRKEKNPIIGERQRVFSSCFDNKNFDEREYIEEVVKNIQVEKNYVFPNAEEFLEDLDNLIWHQEEPFTSTSIYAQWCVIKKAKEKVKVLLDGQGGDELLGGYRKFYFFYLLKFFKNRKLFNFLKMALPFFFSIEILKTLNLKKGLRYSRWGSKINNIDHYLKPFFVKKFIDHELNFSYQDNLGKRFKEDLVKWSLPVLLRYEDKNSGAFGVEPRLPFLDYRLVEQVSKMPLSQKMYSGWTKFILRKAMKGILPEKIRLRKDKLGFVTPEEVWYKNELNRDINLVFNDSQFITEYVNIREVLNSFHKYNNSRFSTIFGSSNIFFRFYILELWSKKFILKR